MPQAYLFIPSFVSLPETNKEDHFRKQIRAIHRDLTTKMGRHVAGVTYAQFETALMQPLEKALAAPWDIGGIDFETSLADVLHHLYPKLQIFGYVHRERPDHTKVTIKIRTKPKA